jgi:hypothetical protein
LATQTASIDALAALNAEAANLCAADHHQDAIPIFERVLADCQAALGKNHPATLTVAGNLAVTCMAAGWQVLGVRLLTAHLANRANLLGDEDPRTLTARDALAVAHRLAGDIGPALALSIKVTDQRRRILGPTHPDTLTSQMGLALALDAAGDLRRAITLLTTAINDADRAHGPTHTHTIALRECRGAFMMDPGPGLDVHELLTPMTEMDNTV